MTKASTSALRRAPLTRERIFDTAIRLMDTEGLEAITMRRIGRELGVEAMSLYNHIADKEDILNGVVEAVMAEYEFPPTSEDWRETARRAARSWRNLLKSHPNVITLMSEQRKPTHTIEALRPMDFALGVIASQGLGPEETVRAFRAFGGYIQGFVLAEIANMFGGDAHAMMAQDAASTIPADLLPHLAAHLPFLEDCDFDGEFEYGLDLMLRGLEAKLAQG
jgi:AcrR family transcriptional regulator